MAEYIDKAELTKAMYQESFEKDSDLQRWDSGCWIRYKLFEDVLDSIPSADVVPVVRCKDCQYWQESRYGIIEMNACLRFDSPLVEEGFIFKANAEDFCSFAKRITAPIVILADKDG